MASIRLKLFNDITNRRLVKGILQPDAFILPSVFDQDQLSIELQLYEAVSGGGVSTPLSAVAPSGIAVTISIFSTDLATLYASQTSFTVSGTLLVGILNLNTSAMGTAISGKLKLDCTLSILLIDASGQETSFQGPIVVMKSGNTSGTPTVVPGVTYYTSDQCKAIFVKKIGDPGESITLINLDNTHGNVVLTNAAGELETDPFVP